MCLSRQKRMFTETAYNLILVFQNEIEINLVALKRAVLIKR